MFEEFLYSMCRRAVCGFNKGVYAATLMNFNEYRFNNCVNRVAGMG